MITFTSITYKNFRSVGNSPITIKLDASNTTLITGKNGSGKSTLMAAIFFCLFGEDFVLNKAGIVNSINLKQLEVALSFEIGNNKYKVVRGIKPNIFKIYKDDVLVNEESTTRDYQKILETQILKMDKRAFKQVVSVGGRHYVPFMKLKTADRRDFIEDLLDIRIFSTMSELLKFKVKTLKEEVRTIDEELKTIKEKVTLQDAFVKKLTNEKSVSIDKIETGIRHLDSEISGIENNLKSETGILEKLLNRMAEFSNIQNEKSQLTHELNSLRGKKSAHESKVKFYNETTMCPTCTQQIAHTHREIILKENGLAIDSVELSIADIENKLALIQIKIGDQNQIKDEIGATQELISEYQTKIATNKKIIERARQQIIDMNSDNSSIDSEKEKLRNFAKRFLELDKQRKGFLEISQYQEFTQKILADDGIKTKIIKQYIPMINKYVNLYLDKLDFFCSYHLDENFNETVKSRHRDSFTYDNFSDGQAARIDLALMFAWREIAKSRNAVNTNLLFLDEADKAMDDEGAALLSELLKTFDKTNVFVISHKGDKLADKVDRVIKFNLVNNFTVLESTT